MTLGKKIQQLRQENNMSQKELAMLIEVTTGTIAEWEADDATPNLTELSRLSKALHVPADTLLYTDLNTSETSHTTLKLAPENQRKSKYVIGIALICVVTLAIIALLLTQAFFTSKSLHFAEDTAKIEQADASVVTLFCYDYNGKLVATGSGFIAFNSKTIITNYHVMTSSYTCKVSTNQDISYEVSNVLCFSKEQDIAILQLDKDTGLQPLPLGNSEIIKKGETVVAIGSPLGIKNTVSTGVLSSRLMEANMDVLQFTAPISSGSSGGALFDNSGNVIGITYASYMEGQNLNLAIPIELAISLYDSKGEALSASAICTAEHPYMEYLKAFNNIPEVTLQELKTNPRKYDNVIIQLTAYISSFDGSDFWGSDKIYISNYEYISNDIAHDFELSSSYNFEVIPVMALTRSSVAETYQEDWEVGNQVTIIGAFNYGAVGEPILGPYGTRTVSSGTLVSYLIFSPS